MGIHIPSQIINSSGLGTYGAISVSCREFSQNKKRRHFVTYMYWYNTSFGAIPTASEPPHTRRRSSSELLRLSLIFRIGSQNYCAYIHPHQPHRRATALRVSTSFGLGLGRRLVGLGLNEVRRKALIPIPYTRVVKRLPPTKQSGIVVCDIV